jgi:hypothetical protein
VLVGVVNHHKHIISTSLVHALYFQALKKQLREVLCLSCLFTYRIVSKLASTSLNGALRAKMCSRSNYTY